ncbi:MAG: butyrate kinase [Nitrososphaeraceae archaeon]
MSDKLFTLLIINPGSTGIKISIFENENEKFKSKINFNYFDAQKRDKKILIDIANKIIRWVKVNKYSCSTFDAIVSRAGLLCPIPSGVYIIDEDVIEDLSKNSIGWHASNMGPLISNIIASENNLNAYLVDPITVDEMNPVAKLTGLPYVERKSIFHALNHKAIARRACKEKGKNYEDVNLIVAHLGSGITIGAHEKGKVVDVNNGLNGEGPFSTERCNDIPNCDLIDMCFSGKYNRDQVLSLISSKGGLYAYFKTKDISQIRGWAREGDELAQKVLSALAYQVSKEICKNAAVLKGDIDAIIITGGLAYDQQLINDISERIIFLAPIWKYPGEEEMLALCEGGLSILRGEREVFKYSDFKK